MGVPIPRSVLNTLAVVVITLVLSYLTLIFGELVPKRVAMRKADALALGMSGLISTPVPAVRPAGVAALRLHQRRPAAAGH